MTYGQYTVTLVMFVKRFAADQGSFNQLVSVWLSHGKKMTMIGSYSTLDPEK